MSVPISNALGIKNDLNNTFVEKNYDKLNYLKFLKPNDNMFPLLSLLKVLPNKNTLFETILITLNDTLVKKYLNGSINYNSIQLNLLKHIKNPYFKKFYKLKPKNIYDIKKTVVLTKSYLEKNLI